MHGIITREIRQFIKTHGRYRFHKLYALIKEDASREEISHLLDISSQDVQDWQQFFGLVDTEDLPLDFRPPQKAFEDSPPPSRFELIINPNPIENREKTKKPSLYII